ncbi:MAG: hypothetical protein R3B70_11965 [Polyangiaceae bacterium]
MNTDNVLLQRFRAGADQGLLLAICAGSSKDEGGCVAAGATACEYLDAFERGLLSEADVAPTLRRATLAAHDAVLKMSRQPLADLPPLHTVAGARTSLKGIGAATIAIAAVAGRLWVVHVGGCRAYLLRDGRLRKLNLEHTLSYVPEYRQMTKSDPSAAHEAADYLWTRSLGTAENAPNFDVSRMELLPGDRALVGSDALTDQLAATVTSHMPQSLEHAQKALDAALSATHLPVTFGILDVLNPGSPY